MTDLIDLDALFKEARKALHGQKVQLAKAKAKPEEDAPPDTQGIYRNPANWIKGRGIALIHRATQTLLGNFTEYTHRTVKDARRLVRELAPPPVQQVEYIDLDLATGTGEPPAPKRAWHQVLPLECPVTLLAFQAIAPCVSLLAHFGEGDLKWLELAECTCFETADGILRLPSGTNILPELAPSQINAILHQLNQPTPCQ